MRRIDKKLNMMKVNLLAESRYLESKKLIKESTFAIDYIREHYLNNVQGGELDENRFSHPKREYEELLKNDDIKGFVDRFHQYRDKALANVGMEIRPVFSEVDVRFVDKNTPTSGGNNFFDTRIKSDTTDYESGQIMFKYNDITCLFTGKLQGDSILYTYDKSLKTNYNKPTTVEALRVANEFEKMCESFTFRLRKDEVPTVFYKK